MVKRSLASIPLAILLAGISANAQAPLSPAPMLGIGKDVDGRPLPFGIPPYFAPGTPLGGGPYKAIMATDPGLPEHVVYHPANLDAAGRLPIVVWGNGACMHAGNRFRIFLTEIASHGFLVISAGRLEDPALEVGPQENPAVRRAGDPPPPPAIPADPNSARARRSTVDHMRQAIDWAIEQNTQASSTFRGRLDTSKIAVAGQSCGGGLSTRLASDPRVTTVGIFNSGTRLSPPGGVTAGATPPDPDAAKKLLDAVHTPILYVTGDADLDIAFAGGQDSFNYLTKVPVVWAWQDKLQHIGTYGAPGGGSLGRIAVAWFAWQLKGDALAAKMFKGRDCTLCKDTTWHVSKKKID
jgi:dienelactone hydrolase